MSRISMDKYVPFTYTILLCFRNKNGIDDEIMQVDLLFLYWFLWYLNDGV